MTAAVTANCGVGQHDLCDGYTDPLRLGDTRPCPCTCHNGLNPRDYQRALAEAAIAAYGGSGGNTWGAT
jgi:hypothetical protein